MESQPRPHTAAHRAFLDPRGHDHPRKFANRFANSCTSPVHIPRGQFTDHEYHVRCRHCPGCLRSRRFLWRLRAEYEIYANPRTWFFTGTFANQTTDPVLVNRQITLYLKRLRRNTRLPIRYLIAIEPHKSGKLHCHSLLHSEPQLSWRHVTSNWDQGYTKANLANPEKHPGYISKYLTKELLESTTSKRIRVRSSRKYGAPVLVYDAKLLPRAKDHEHDINTLWTNNLKQLIRHHRDNQQEQELLWNLINDPATYLPTDK